jgi:transposase-like protein
MAQATTIIGLAKELGIRRKLLYQWRDQLRAGGRAGLERRRGRPPGSKSQTVSPPVPRRKFGDMIPISRDAMHGKAVQVL